MGIFGTINFCTGMDIFGREWLNKFMLMKMQYNVRVVAIGIILMLGFLLLTICCGCCKREVEIVPGLKWKYYSDQYSCLIWDEFGVIAEGRFQLIFCDQGLCVTSSNGRDPCYLDLRRKHVLKLNEAGTNLWCVAGEIFSIDAQTAMGVYCNSGIRLFEQAKSNLNARLQIGANSRSDPSGASLR